MYTLTIQLLSPTMLMSGQGDVNTDSTIVHDRYGIPFIPAKRVRGVLYESALEVAEMMEMSKMTAFTTDDVKVLFNRLEGITDEPRLSISNLTISDYDVVSRELAQLEEQYPCLLYTSRIKTVHFHIVTCKLQQYLPFMVCAAECEAAEERSDDEVHTLQVPE